MSLIALSKESKKQRILNELNDRMKDLLIEIGVEELPAGYIRPAMVSWQAYIQERLQELYAINKLDIIPFSTPRRLALHIKNIPEKQKDEVVEKTGPAVNVAFDSEGKLSRGGQGFLRGANIVTGIECAEELNIEAISKNKEESGKPYIKKTVKGEYLAVKQTVQGKDSVTLLSDVCRESVSKIVFPKMMRWSQKNFRFARPIRWIMALYGDEVLPFEIAGLKSGNITYGNVFTDKAKSISVSQISDYYNYFTNYDYSQLSKPQGKRRSLLVIADRDERREIILKQLKDCTDYIDLQLLEEVTDIVEYPTLMYAHYDEQFLALPVKVIHSTLAKNQRYFPAYKDEHSLKNAFFYVANNNPDYAEETIDGNQRVVKARLADAEFYFNDDKAKSIDYFNRKLEGIVFHVRLGSMKEKVERIIKISEYICNQLEITDKMVQKVLRAAEICKFDLATAMIGEKEFTGLQGYMGKEYALIWGEDEQVAQAVEEHYLPFGIGEDIPAGLIGKIISIADKMDTLVSFFGIGIIPSGSKDQYALRRGGNGVIATICRGKLALHLQRLINHCYSLIADKLPDKYANRLLLDDFFKARISQYLELSGIDYDVINAVLAIDYDDILKVISRAEAVQSIRNREDFKHLMLSFKRVSNIIAAENNFIEINLSLFKEQAEKELHQAVEDVEMAVGEFLRDYKYGKILEKFIELNTVIDTFFVRVLVNATDEELRKNRYALLNSIRQVFLNIGDLSLIVIEGEKGSN